MMGILTFVKNHDSLEGFDFFLWIDPEYSVIAIINKDRIKFLIWV